MVLDANFTESSANFNADFGVVSVLQVGDSVPNTWLTSVTLLASAWTGTGGQYSQVVTIAGLSKHSKIDLQPSVEQLAIFHEKDLAFVVENEDGVATVYAIGDKPTQDYTIQSTITEVDV